MASLKIDSDDEYSNAFFHSKQKQSEIFKNRLKCDHLGLNIFIKPIIVASHHYSFHFEPPLSQYIQFLYKEVKATAVCEIYLKKIIFSLLTCIDDVSHIVHELEQFFHEQNYD